MQTSFIAHFNGWKGGETILLVVDHQDVRFDFAIRPYSEGFD
jgi:hypothetical protein